MSVIENAIQQIQMEIPGEILQLAFLPRRYDPSRRKVYIDGQTPVSIDAMIRDIIIQGYVGKRINRETGQDEDIPLRDIPFESIDYWNSIYRIPDNLTRQRTITAVKKVTYGNHRYGGTAGTGCSGNNALMGAAQGLMAPHSKPGLIGTAEVTIVGHNTVQITDVNRIQSDIILTCTLSHNMNFDDISAASQHRFDELCVLATKAYIHTKLNIQLDEGAINSGANNGRIREVVDGYADAIQMYKDYMLEKWRPAAMINNKKQYRKIMGYAVGGRR